MATPPKGAQSSRSLSKKDTKGPLLFPVVLLGASAGGLKAIQGFLGKLPAKPGLALVIIQHLDPRKSSQMTEIISRYTKLKILTISDKLPLQNNMVYVAPPGFNVFLRRNILHLAPYEHGESIHLPIDHFLRSLAVNFDSRAIAVILSGTGSDGCLGIREIKANHGTVVTQDPDEAEYQEMPMNSIQTGLVDFSGPVENLAQRIINYIKHPSIYKEHPPRLESMGSPQMLHKIFEEIMAVTEHDFSGYKESTILRRLERKMALHRFLTLDDYVQYLMKHREEVFELSNDFLISVTSFFRDPETFASLKKHVKSDLKNSRISKDSFRVWVPACATGEEAYTLAIILHEVMSELKCNMNVQIFATDISESSIEIARKGYFPRNIESDITKERLNRFFVIEDDHYRIAKEIRDMIVFAKHDVLRDAPFSGMSLISCRNLLIYLNPNIQKQVLGLFSYSLRKNGILFLGSSESLGESDYLFSDINEKGKLFKHRGKSPDAHYFPPEKRKIYMQESSHINKDAVEQLNLLGRMQKIIFEEFSYPCVLVNSKLKIIFFRGNTEDFLRTPEGQADFDLLNMARDDCRLALSKAMRMVKKEEKTIIEKDISLLKPDRTLFIDLIVRPIKSDNRGETYFLVIFKQTGKSRAIQKTDSDLKLEKDQIVAALHDDIANLKLQLKSSVEELQQTNEHLQSLNEELHAKNEELQSSNEELRTSQEELNSTNEEMVIVNSELKEKLNELSNVHSDINNLLASTDIATLFLDEELNVKRYTPRMLELFQLKPNDLGRPITDITSKIPYNILVDKAAMVLGNLETYHSELKDERGEWYSIKIMPYRSVENVIEGLVMTFVNITKMKYLGRLENIVRDSSDAITLQDTQGNIIAWNKGAEEIYGYSEKQALQMNISELIPKDRVKEYRDTTEQALMGKEHGPIVTKRTKRDGRNVEVEISIHPITDPYAKTTEIATTERLVLSPKPELLALQKEIRKLKSDLKKQKGL